jgi:L-arabinose isomerase
MTEMKILEVWFVTGSQHLYGQKTLRQVNEHSQTIASMLSEGTLLPVKMIFKPVLTTPEEICELCTEANSARNCIGLVMWMHTFSPAKMWIAGLTSLKKPFCAPSHSVRLQSSLEHHRHELHEPKPVGAWGS